MPMPARSTASLMRPVQSGCANCWLSTPTGRRRRAERRPSCRFTLPWWNGSASARRSWRHSSGPRRRASRCGPGRQTTPPGSGSEPSQSLPVTCATEHINATMLLPIAPSPENNVTCRNGIRSFTAHSRSGHGSLSHCDVSIQGSGSGFGSSLASARAGLNETTGSCRVIVTPLRLPGCNVSSSMFIFPNKIIEITD